MVDVLSEKVHHVYEISYSQVEIDFSKEIKEATLHDPEYEFIW